MIKLNKPEQEMKMRKIWMVALWILLTPLAAFSQTYLQSNSTQVLHPAQMAFDTDSNSYWQLNAGQTAGWVQIATPAPLRVTGARIDAQVPSGTTLTFKRLTAGGMIAIPGGVVAGPVNSPISVMFPGEMEPSTRYVVELKGPSADSAKVFEISWLNAASAVPFGKIAPISYTTNFNQYINIQASRLWDNSIENAWFEPIWSIPSEVLNTTAANKPVPIFPPYTGNPSVSGEIVWDLGQSYEISVLKAYFLQPGRSVRFEFWNGSSWSGAVNLANSSQSGWQRTALASSVVSNKVRITFPGGWETARFLGEVEVWGSGFADSKETPLILSQPDSSGAKHATTAALSTGNSYVLKVLTASSTQSLTGEFNAQALSFQKSANPYGSNLFKASIDPSWILSGTQFVKVNAADSVQSAWIEWAPSNGQIDLGAPWSNGFFDQSSNSPVNPLLTNQNWPLSGVYQLEKIRVYAKNLSNPPVFQIAKAQTVTNVSWSVQQNGYWEANLNGALADSLKLISDVPIQIDQIQLYGSPTFNVKNVVEIWWPQSSDLNPVTSPQNDGNSMIGWLGDSQIQPLLGGLNPSNRQADHLVWLPLGQMGLFTDETANLVFSGTKNGLTNQVSKNLIWGVNLPLTLDQGNALLATTSSSVTISGTVQNNGVRVFAGGQELTITNKKFSKSFPLVDGYQTLRFEVWNQNKNHLKQVIVKPVYKAFGAPLLEFDLPPGDTTAGMTSMPMMLHVGGGIGLSVTLANAAQSLVGDQVQKTLPLVEGVQTFTFVVTDSLGRSQNYPITFGRDTTPPVISITSPTGGRYYTQNSIQFTAQGNAADLPLAWKFQNDPWILSNDATYSRVLNLADGNYTYQIQAQDPAGNLSAVQSVSFTIDTTPPAAFEIGVDVSGWTNKNNPTLTFATTDATSGLARYEYSADGGTWTAVTSPYQTQALADGVHILSIRAIDKAGNIQLETKEIDVDTTAPVKLNALRGIPGGTSIQVVWTTTDTDVVKFHVTRTPAWSDGEHTSTVPNLTDAGLSAGDSYTYQVWAEDRAGNLGPQTMTQTTITGLGIQEVSTDPANPTVVEYKGLTAVIPVQSLPDNNIAVMIKQIDSPTLQNLSNYPIVSPIYELSTLAKDDQGNLSETTHSEFSKEIVMILDYDPHALPNGFPETNLGVYYFDTTWSKWFKVEKSAVDTTLHKIVFTTNHFTSFSVQPTMITDLSPQQLKDIGHSPTKTESSEGAVTVSPQGGTAMTEVTDFVLPGKNGFSLPIKRIYDTGTALADSPSLTLSASLSFNSIGDLLNAAGIGAQLVSQGVGGMVGSIKGKVLSLMQQNGDYALGAGVGWRLNFPYVSTNNTSVMVRLPSGGYYNINQMQSNNNFWTSNPVNRTLDFEYHEGEDFHFRVKQIRSNVSDVANLLSGLAASKLSSAINQKLFSSTQSSSGSGGPSVASLISMAASVIPGWVTVSSELWTKDGTYYLFDSNGRIAYIQDKTGVNTYQFHYNGPLLLDVTDDMGRVVRFEYNVPAATAQFVKPVVTRIIFAAKAASPERSVNLNYDFNVTSSVGAFFNFLPTLTSTTDALGRTYSYGYDQKSIVTGGGAIKVNFLALLLDFIPGVGSSIADSLGISALTLSGNLEINVPFTINHIVAPGIGTTDISVSAINLSKFDFKPTDYFLSLFPTALEISFQIVFKLATDRVTVTSTTGVVKTTNYSYHWSVSDHQFYVDHTSVNDGRLRTELSFAAYSVTRNRYISWDDYLLSQAESLFQSDGLTIQELFTLQSDSTSYDSASGSFLEETINTWDTSHHRLVHSVTTRGPQTYQTADYSYDSWGNQTSIIKDELANGLEQKIQQWNWFLGTDSSASNVWTAGALPNDENFDTNIHDLLKGTVTRNYLPDGSYQDRFQGYSYNALGLKKSEGTWRGDHWAETDYTYYTDSTQLTAGAVQTIVGPLAGQLTQFNYDFSHSGDYYTVSTVQKAIKDISGTVSDLTTEIQFDWNTGWKICEKDALGYVTSYQYDLLGRVTDTWKPGNEVPLAMGNWNVVRNNSPWDHIVYTDTPAPSASVSKGTWTTGASTVPSPILEFYQYDSLGQLIQIEKYAYQNGAVAQTARTTATYSPWGDVTSLTDPNGNTTSYQYDAKGRISKQTHADGTFQSIVYDDSHNQKTTTNERGIKTVEYLNWNDKPVKSIVDSDSLRVTTETVYDGIGEVVQTIDPLGQITKTTYNEFGKPERIELPSVAVGSDQTVVTPLQLNTYDDAGRLVVQKTGSDGNLRTQTVTYDLAGRAIVKNVDGRQEWNWYDAKGQLIQHADPLAVSQIQAGTLDPSGSIGLSHKTYTSRGQVASETDPTGAVVRYAYDFKDRKVQMKDPRASADINVVDSFTIGYSYNDLDRLVGADLPPVQGAGRATITIDYDLRGNAIKQTDALGRVTTWTYDNRNRKTSQSVKGADSSSNVLASAWAYDATNNVVKEIVVKTFDSTTPANSVGLVTNKIYDALGRLTEVDLPDGEKSVTTLDALGRPVAVSDAKGFTTSTQYNSLNKPTKITDAKNGDTLNAYSVFGENVQTILKNANTGDQIWTRTFDAWGELSTEANNAGQTWSYEYDPRGLAVRIVDPKSIVTSNVWDAAGRIVSKTQTLGAAVQTQSWEYDLAGSLKKATDGSVETLVNTSAGNYIADPYDLVNHYQTTVSGKTLNTDYTYDNAHNVTSISYPDASVVNYLYNSLGQLTGIPGYATGGQYNFMGRLTSLSATNGTVRTKTWNETTGTLDGYDYGIFGKTSRSLEWDNVGNLIHQTKDGATSDYLYDQLNRLVYANEANPAEVKAADNLPRGISARDVGGRTALNFNADTQNVKFDYNATSLGIDLTSPQRINKIKLVGTLGSRIAPRNVNVYTSQTGTDDSWTRVPEVLWTQDQTSVTLQFKNEVTAQYVKVNCTYDERDDNNAPVDLHTVQSSALTLLEVYFNVNGQTTSWTYDELGNRLSQDQIRGVQTQTAYTYYPNTNLIKTAGMWKFNYDANQNLTAKGTNGVWNEGNKNFDFDNATGEVFAYEWDLTNRLVKVSHGKTGTASLAEVETNVYDSRSLRVAQTKKAITTYYQYDQSGDLIYKESFVGKRKYVQALGQTWAEVRTQGTYNTTYWHHTDYEGTTDTITDFNGHVVWSANYEVFGSVVSSNGTIDFDATYTGKEFDADTGLYYFNARWQDPTIGRFISSDPARADGWSWVAYVGNNPLRWVDSTGLKIKWSNGSPGNLNVSKEQQEMAMQAVQKIVSKSETAKNILQELETSLVVIDIDLYSYVHDGSKTEPVSENEVAVSWAIFDGLDTAHGEMNAGHVLIHELGHALHFIRNPESILHERTQKDIYMDIYQEVVGSKKKATEDDLEIINIKYKIALAKFMSDEESWVVRNVETPVGIESNGGYRDNYKDVEKIKVLKTPLGNDNKDESGMDKKDSQNEVKK